MKKWKGRVFAIDFDGVIHSYKRGYTGEIPEDPPTDGAREFVEELVYYGIHVVVHTCRAGRPGGVEAVAEWLMRYGFPRDLEITAIKPPAHWYLDDRGLRFEGDFDQVREMMELLPWYRQKGLK